MSLPARMFSSTLMSSNSSSDWNERRSPSRARCVAFNRSMRRSSSEIDPPLTGTKPVTASMSVVLPAPFGPIRPTTSPGLDLQRHVVDRDHRTEADGQVRDRQRRRRHRLDVGRREAAALLAPARRGGASPTAGRSWATTSAMPFWWTMRITNRMTRADDEVPLVLEVDPVLDDARAEAADRVRRAEHRAEHVAEAADHRVPEAVDRREDVELACR